MTSAKLYLLCVSVSGEDAGWNKGAMGRQPSLFKLVGTYVLIIGIFWHGLPVVVHLEDENEHERIKSRISIQFVGQTVYGQVKYIK